MIGLPHSDKPWRTTFADLIITGTQCQLFKDFVGQRPRAIPDGFEAQLRAFREHDARELPEAGLWYRASLSLNAKGSLRLSRGYIEEPRDGIRLDDEGLQRDAAHALRTPYWTPAWLARRLAE
jgi:hypothetical protein